VPPLDCGDGAPACAQLGASVARERVGGVRELRRGLGSPPTGFSAAGTGPAGTRDGLDDGGAIPCDGEQFPAAEGQTEHGKGF